MEKELANDVAEYLVQRHICEQKLIGKNASIAVMEFTKADRIIADAILQARGVLSAISCAVDVGIEAGQDKKPSKI
ncbi:hypothetical protein KO527_05075 [Pseudoalteromonas sp. C2R02]|uniref:hypothetical protein n=1 Tax=Pseudoalteromonas sp. C2R02 TaxID=2841565 RepID=UPI001C0A1B74|nr:hypothetical protein [Pseudoalteromonas sp. C2R02]MBU2968719.1 hypothetical protein [Pseudoalteromonas sp. C2R02]